MGRILHLSWILLSRDLVPRGLVPVDGCPSYMTMGLDKPTGCSMLYCAFWLTCWSHPKNPMGLARATTGHRNPNLRNHPVRGLIKIRKGQRSPKNRQIVRKLVLRLVKMQ